MAGLLSVPFFVLASILGIVTLGVYVASRDYVKTRRKYQLGAVNVHNFADAGERMANVVMMSVAVAALVVITWKMAVVEPQSDGNIAVAQSAR